MGCASSKPAEPTTTGRKTTVGAGAEANSSPTRNSIVVDGNGSSPPRADNVGGFTPTTTSKKQLSIDTKAKEGEEIIDSVPDVAPASTTSTAAASDNHLSPAVFTPRDQPIMSENERGRQAIIFVQGLDLSWDNQDIESRNRAKRIMSSDFTWIPTNFTEQRYETTFGDEFNEFVQEINVGEPLRTLVSSGVFFDENAIEQYLVVRRQKSGMCSLHSGVVQQHYLQCCRNPAEAQNHTMLDVCGFMKNSLPRAKQIQYITTGTCDMGSEDFFRMITGIQQHKLKRVQFSLKSTHPEYHRIELDYFFNYVSKIRARLSP